MAVGKQNNLMEQRSRMGPRLFSGSASLCMSVHHQDSSLAPFLFYCRIAHPVDMFPHPIKAG